MKLLDLISVMDSDTRIHIEYNYAEIYEGTVIHLLTNNTLKAYANLTVKVIWYSPIYKAIMIEL